MIVEVFKPGPGNQLKWWRGASVWLPCWCRETMPKYYFLLLDLGFLLSEYPKATSNSVIFSHQKGSETQSRTAVPPPINPDRKICLHFMTGFVLGLLPHYESIWVKLSPWEQNNFHEHVFPACFHLPASSFWWTQTIASFLFPDLFIRCRFVLKLRLMNILFAITVIQCQMCWAAPSDVRYQMFACVCGSRCFVLTLCLHQPDFFAFLQLRDLVICFKLLL